LKLSSHFGHPFVGESEVAPQFGHCLQEQRSLTIIFIVPSSMTNPVDLSLGILLGIVCPCADKDSRICAVKFPSDVPLTSALMELTSFPSPSTRTVTYFAVVRPVDFEFRLSDELDFAVRVIVLVSLDTMFVIA